MEEFAPISLVQWAPDGRICALKEFGCNRNTYDPYAEFWHTPFGRKGKVVLRSPSMAAA